ncbi:MAG TPA: N-6 DNA methylase [Candidatus Anaerobiospirillum stercoravium]|nr:N-6 DNA methylase [Candidatus Anaerobiospirillum stercoravium]
MESVLYIPQESKARQFINKWQAAKGSETQEGILFLLELFGVTNTQGQELPDINDLIKYQEAVRLGTGKNQRKVIGRIDLLLEQSEVLIEQKSKGVDLSKKQRQSDGSMLTPYQQALRYSKKLDASISIIVVCNFDEFWLYNLKLNPAHPELITPKVIKLDADFEHNVACLRFLLDPSMLQQDDPFTPPPSALSIDAGYRIARLYNELLPLYQTKDQERVHQDLNKFCVRMVFCFYASDAGLFNDDQGHNLFQSYLENVPAKVGSLVLQELFLTLNTPSQERKAEAHPFLRGLPYVDGGLFEQAESALIPVFNDKVTQLLCDEHYYNWRDINPTIFGAVFESTFDPEGRRFGGIHYTTEANIHKVIDPLFLDELKTELNACLSMADPKARTNKLCQLQDHLASLTFLDPACGSGNFLTETYLSLRRLENQIVRELYAYQSFLGLKALTPIKVSLEQFAGIEINDFAVAVAKTSLWIADIKMRKATKAIINETIDELPLKDYDNIVVGNALTMDWSRDVKLDKIDYIMGNPPFSGARVMTKANKQDLQQALGPDWPTHVWDLDFVSGWFKKAHDVMAQEPHIKTAFVATNSICQGTSITNLWAPLLQGGSEIIFAHRSFLWHSDAIDQAHVYCVIIGLTHQTTKGPKFIFSNQEVITTEHINAYLMEGEDTFIYDRHTPLCPSPIGLSGCQRLDDNHYIFTTEEKNEFLQLEPQAAPYFKRWYGSKELLQGKIRYCLYLGQCSVAELAQMPEVRKRVEAVRQYRLTSSSAKPNTGANEFHYEPQLQNDFLVIPRVSSSNRDYIPIVFLHPDDGLCSDQVKLFPDATLYHFSVLSSSVHMVWVKMVAGRLKMDFRYSTELVYNNFPWPQELSAQRRRTLAQAAQAILDARAQYPKLSLAQLYDPKKMPPSLRKAHQHNDRLVLKAYGFDPTWSQEQIFAALFKLYAKLIAAEKQRLISAESKTRRRSKGGKAKASAK